MSNLDFINKEIKKQKDTLSILKREKYYYEQLDNIGDWIIGYEEEIHNTNQKIDTIEYNLNHLQQIKTIIEAWEVAFYHTMGDDFRYEINVYKTDWGYEKFDKAFEMYNKKR